MAVHYVFQNELCVQRLGVLTCVLEKKEAFLL